jgi:choice-of-anchor B domain-containing protein
MKNLYSVLLLLFSTFLSAQDKQDAFYMAEINSQLTAKTALIGNNPDTANPDKILARVPCVQNQAAGFPCNKVDLMSFLSIAQIGGTATTELSGNWGWTDPASKREFVLQGSSIGTHFIEVTNPEVPVYVGLLPIPPGAQENIWRELKTYKNYAYIVGDVAGDHGLQIFNLNKLLTATNLPVTFTQDAQYKGFGSAHDMVINESTGFAYPVGISSLYTGVTGRGCGGGSHILDLNPDPLNPVFKGCYQHLNTGRSNTGYSHDALCVTYKGPDLDYKNKEICFGFNETALSIADVTDKANIKTISKGLYNQTSYCHQGWLTEDHRYMYIDDELDETNRRINTRTIIFDLADLDNPTVVKYFTNTTAAIDHNQYIRGRYDFQANYTAGLRILDVIDPINPVEVAYFDTYKANDNATFDGLWNVYAFFPSGNVAVGGINEGVFVLRPTLPGHATATELNEIPETAQLEANYPNPFDQKTTFTLKLSTPQSVEMQVFDVLGRQVKNVASQFYTEGTHYVELDGKDLANGNYMVRINGEHQQFKQMITVNRLR